MKVRRTFLMVTMVTAILIGLSASSYALLLDTGSPIIAIDGNNDSNVTVWIESVGISSYEYGYFLNSSALFVPVANIPAIPYVGITAFQGGDVIDFALYDGSKYYTLSGDAADSTYSVQMTFGNEVLVGSPQQPAGWNAPYYYNANITWSLGATVNTNELSLNFNNGNDGVAPVPEPATLLLLGSGLLGCVALAKLRGKKTIG